MKCNTGNQTVMLVKCDISGKKSSNFHKRNGKDDVIFVAQFLKLVPVVSTVVKPVYGKYYFQTKPAPKYLKVPSQCFEYLSQWNQSAFRPVLITRTLACFSTYPFGNDLCGKMKQRLPVSWPLCLSSCLLDSLLLFSSTILSYFLQSPPFRIDLVCRRVGELKGWWCGASTLQMLSNQTRRRGCTL